MVRHLNFRVSRGAAQHILEKHDVTEEEALEAVQSSVIHRRTRDDPHGRRRYVVAGKTEVGRRLWVVFEDEGRGEARIVTAREPSGGDVTRHRRMRGD